MKSFDIDNFGVSGIFNKKKLGFMSPRLKIAVFGRHKEHFRCMFPTNLDLYWIREESDLRDVKFDGFLTTSGFVGDNKCYHALIGLRERQPELFEGVPYLFEDEEA